MAFINKILTYILKFVKFPAAELWNVETGLAIFCKLIYNKIIIMTGKLTNKGEYYDSYQQ